MIEIAGNHSASPCGELLRSRVGKVGPLVGERRLKVLAGLAFEPR